MSDTGHEDGAKRRYAPETRKLMILQAAAKVLGNNPMATLEDIAVESGVSRQMISRYFGPGGVEPLIAEMFAGFLVTLRGLYSAVYRRGPAADSAELREVITALIGRWADLVETVDQPWLFLTEPNSVHSTVADGHRMIWAATDDIILDWAAPSYEKTEAVRLAVSVEHRASNDVAYRLLTGE
ncbi:MAG: TetR family transcriptional regulator, partial [Actinobacteria bacterium]|nr:TetR family transcriptional regulator [Actinomycetota bacterium]